MRTGEEETELSATVIVSEQSVFPFELIKHCSFFTDFLLLCCYLCSQLSTVTDEGYNIPVCIVYCMSLISGITHNN